jgi:hypothetical protein
LKTNQLIRIYNVIGGYKTPFIGTINQAIAFESFYIPSYFDYRKSYSFILKPYETL